MAFCNQLGTVEQFINEGRNAVIWTRLSCRRFAANAVRLQLRALAYNLGNFLRTLALLEEVKHWSMTRLRKRLVRIGAKIIRHGRSIIFPLLGEVIVAECEDRWLSSLHSVRRGRSSGEFRLIGHPSGKYWQGMRALGTW